MIDIVKNATAETAEFTPSQGFDDEVPGTVAYALEYDEEMLYLQPVASGYRIMPLRYGRSEVTVVATDEGGLAGRDTFAVMCRDDSPAVVDLSSLGGGTYTIELRYEGGSLTRSIVKL